MQTKNRYARHARISEYKLRMLVKLFVCGESATRISERMKMNRNSINRYLIQIRERIAESASPEEMQWDMLSYDIYFEDLRRCEEEEGRGRADRSFAVRGCPETGEVRVRFLPFAASRTVWEAVALRGPQSGDRHWRSYEILGFRKTFRANWDDCLVRPYDPRDVLDLFWTFVRERLIASRGVPSTAFWLHLRESEFRFNHRRGDLYGVLLRMLEENPLRACAVACGASPNAEREREREREREHPPGRPSENFVAENRCLSGCPQRLPQHAVFREKSGGTAKG